MRGCFELVAIRLQLFWVKLARKPRWDSCTLASHVWDILQHGCDSQLAICLNNRNSWCHVYSTLSLFWATVEREWVQVWEENKWDEGWIRHYRFNDGCELFLNMNLFPYCFWELQSLKLSAYRFLLLITRLSNRPLGGTILNIINRLLFLNPNPY